MQPSAMFLKHLIKICPGPICMFKYSQQSIKMHLLNQSLFPFLRIRNTFANGTILDRPIEIAILYFYTCQDQPQQTYISNLLFLEGVPTEIVSDLKYQWLGIMTLNTNYIFRLVLLYIPNDLIGFIIYKYYQIILQFLYLKCYYMLGDS